MNCGRCGSTQVFPSSAGPSCLQCGWNPQRLTYGPGPKHEDYRMFIDGRGFMFFVRADAVSFAAPVFDKIGTKEYNMYHCMQYSDITVDPEGRLIKSRFGGTYEEKPSWLNRVMSIMTDSFRRKNHGTA